MQFFCETLICPFLTNRKSSFFPLSNKRARQVMRFGRVRLNKIEVSRSFVSCSSCVLT